MKTYGLSKEDWIILRLCRHAVRHGIINRDYERSVLHLIRKHGGPTVLMCVDELNKELK